MPSYPLDGKHGRTTSGVTCHHRLRTANTDEHRRAWHAIIALGRQTRSNDVWLDMPSPPLDIKHDRTTSDVAYHHLLWEAHTVERHLAWHDIIVFEKHKRSDDVGHDMPSPPLDNIHSQTTSGVACHHRPWTANTVERRRAWHAIIAFGQHTQWNEGRGMPLSLLGNRHSRTTSGVA